MSLRQDRRSAVIARGIALMIGMQGGVGIAAAYADEAPLLAPLPGDAPRRSAPAIAVSPSRLALPSDDAATSDKRAAQKKSSQIAQQATTPNAVVSAESSLTSVPPAPRTHQADSKGLIADSHLDLEWRNYTDYFHATGAPHRHAWVEGLQAKFESGFTQGPIGFGFDAALFGALKLDGGKGARNMVHLGRRGDGANRLAWAYPGMYAVQACISNSLLTYGVQEVSNPFLDPHDNRALPPTFLGAALLSRELKGLALQAGSFSKVIARGQTNLSDLRTTYGGVTFKRVSYAGATWDYAPNGAASLYVDQADNVWRQYYASLQYGVGTPESVKLIGFVNGYSTHETGAALQGPLRNNVYSVSLSAQHGPHALLVGYQKVFGEQFFDYIDETAGVYLVNSMDVDYNAPHEQSLQLRYTFDGKYAGVPGLSAIAWAQQGWGADASGAGASASAERYGPNGPSFSALYWKNGQPVHGRHHEFGLIPTYVVQSGPLKHAKVTLIAEWHVGSAYYSDSTNQVYRLLVTLPTRVF
jgi:hypothetical protein